MTEADITKKFNKRLRERYPHAWCKKLNDSRTGGLPDTILVMSGRFAGIEMKKDAFQLTPLQVKTMWDLSQASKGRAFVVTYRSTNKTYDIAEVQDPQGGPTRLLEHGCTLDEAISYIVVATEFGRSDAE